QVSVEGTVATDFPLRLGELLELATGGAVLTGTLHPGHRTWLDQHGMYGHMILPGTALVGLTAEAGARVDAPVLTEFMLEAPLVLRADKGVTVQVVVDAPDDRGIRTVAVHARSEDENSWARHASGRLTTQEDNEPVPQTRAGAWTEGGAGPRSETDMESYDRQTRTR